MHKTYVCSSRVQDRFPNYLITPPPIADLQGFYKESKKRFDEDEEFKRRAYKAVTLLQSGDSAHIQGWRLICDISKTEFNKVLISLFFSPLFFSFCFLFFLFLFRSLLLSRFYLLPIKETNN